MWRNIPSTSSACICDRTTSGVNTAHAGSKCASDFSFAKQLLRRASRDVSDIAGGSLLQHIKTLAAHPASTACLKTAFQHIALLRADEDHRNSEETDAMDGLIAESLLCVAIVEG